MKLALLLLSTGCLLFPDAAWAQDEKTTPIVPTTETQAAAEQDGSSETSQKPVSPATGAATGSGRGAFERGGDMGGMSSGGMGGFGGGLAAGSESMKRQVMGKNLIIAWSKNNDELRGFSLSKGTWTNLKVPRRERLIPVVGANVAVVKLNDGMAAYSSEKQQWAILPLPKDSKSQPRVSDDLVTVYEADHIYTFAASSGRWTSPTDPKLKLTTKKFSKLPTGLNRQDLDRELVRRNLEMTMSSAGTYISGAVGDIASFEEFLSKNSSEAGRLSSVFNLPGSKNTATNNQQGNAQNLSKVSPKTLPLANRPTNGSSRQPRFPSFNDLRSNVGPPMGPPTGPPASPATGRFNFPSSGFPGELATSVGNLNSTSFFYPNTPAGKAEQASLKLAESLRNKQQKEKLTGPDKTELQKLVTSALEERLKAQQKSVDDLRKKLKAVEAKLKSKLDNKQKMIDRRVDELLNPDLDWNSVSTKAKSSAFSTSFFNKSAAPTSIGRLSINASQPVVRGYAFDELLPQEKSKTPQRNPSKTQSPAAVNGSSLNPAPDLMSFQNANPTTIQLPDRLDQSAESLQTGLMHFLNRADGAIKDLENYKVGLAHEQKELDAITTRLVAKPSNADLQQLKTEHSRYTDLINRLKSLITKRQSNLEKERKNWSIAWDQLEALTEAQRSRVEIAKLIAEQCQDNLKTRQTQAASGYIPASETQAALINKKLAELQLKTQEHRLAEFQNIIDERPELNPKNFKTPSVDAAAENPESKADET